MQIAAQNAYSSIPMPSVAVLSFATHDALDRLIVAVEPDAAKRLRASIQSLAIALKMHDDFADHGTIFRSYHSVVDTLNGFRDSARSDATILGNIALQFGLAC